MGEHLEHLPRWIENKRAIPEKTGSMVTLTEENPCQRVYDFFYGACATQAPTSSLGSIIQLSYVSAKVKSLEEKKR